MIVVERPGLRTTVQDLGRAGLAHLGVPRSGAADGFSAALANALVGNPADGALLETTLTGPTLRFEADAVVAATGAAADIRLDGEDVEFGARVRVLAGQRLSIGRAREGLRTYLAVAGGIDVPETLGSRSTDTLSGIGPAALAVGDLFGMGVAVGRPPQFTVSKAVLASVLPGADPVVRVVRGPDIADVTTKSLCSQVFSVSQNTDRIGARLTGAAIGGGEWPTAGMVAGAIQLPPGGAPVVLLADHAVTGGYRVAAVAIGADLPLVAQARPGAPIAFREVSVGVARAAWFDSERRLAGGR